MATSAIFAGRRLAVEVVGVDDRRHARDRLDGGDRRWWAGRRSRRGLSASTSGFDALSEPPPPHATRSGAEQGHDDQGPTEHTQLRHQHTSRSEPTGSGSGSPGWQGRQPKWVSSAPTRTNRRAWDTVVTCCTPAARSGPTPMPSSRPPTSRAGPTGSRWSRPPRRRSRRSSPPPASPPTPCSGPCPTREVTVTAEHAAINAVMAGCRPEYFPVVVAAVRAHLDEHGELPLHHRHALGRGPRRHRQRPDPRRARRSPTAPGASVRASGPTRRSDARCAWSSATCAARCPASSTGPPSRGRCGTRSASARTRAPATGRHCTSSGATTGTRARSPCTRSCAWCRRGTRRAATPRACSTRSSPRRATTGSPATSSSATASTSST